MGQAATFGAALPSVPQIPLPGAPIAFDMASAQWEIDTSLFSVVAKGKWNGVTRLTSGSAAVDFRPSRGEAYQNYTFGAPRSDKVVKTPTTLHLEGWVNEAERIYYHADYTFYSNKPYFKLHLAITDNSGSVGSNEGIGFDPVVYGLVSDAASTTCTLTAGSDIVTGYGSSQIIRLGHKFWWPSFTYQDGVEKHEFFGTVTQIISGSSFKLDAIAPMSKTGVVFYYHENRQCRNFGIRVGAVNGTPKVLQQYHPWFGADATAPYCLVYEVALIGGGKPWGWSDGYIAGNNIQPDPPNIVMMHECANGLDTPAGLNSALHGRPRRDNRVEFYPLYAGAAVITLRYATGPANTTGVIAATGATAEVLDQNNAVKHTASFDQVIGGTTFVLNSGNPITLASTDKVVFRATGSGRLHVKGITVAPTNSDPAILIDTHRLGDDIVDGPAAIICRDFWHISPGKLIRTTNQIGCDLLVESGGYQIQNTLNGGHGWAAEFMIHMDAEASGIDDAKNKLYEVPTSNLIASNPSDYADTAATQLDTEFDDFLEGYRDMFAPTEATTAIYGLNTYGDHANRGLYHGSQADLGVEYYNCQSGLPWVLFAGAKRLNDTGLWGQATASARHARDVDLVKYYPSSARKFCGIGCRKNPKLIFTGHARGGHVLEYSYYGLVGLEMYRATGEVYWLEIWKQVVDLFGYTLTGTDSIQFFGDGTTTVTVKTPGIRHRWIAGQDFKIVSTVKSGVTLGWKTITSVVDDYTWTYTESAAVSSAGNPAGGSTNGTMLGNGWARFYARTPGKPEATIDKVIRKAKAFGYTGRGARAPFNWENIWSDLVHFKKSDAAPIGRLYGIQPVWIGQTIQLLYGYYLEHTEDTALKDLIINDTLRLYDAMRVYPGGFLNTYDIVATDGTPYTNEVPAASPGLGTPPAFGWSGAAWNAGDKVTASVTLTAVGSLVTVNHANHGLVQGVGYNGTWMWFQNFDNAAFGAGAAQSLTVPSVNPAAPGNTTAYRFPITITGPSSYTFTVSGVPPATGSAYVNLGREPTGLDAGTGTPYVRFYPALWLSAIGPAFSLGYRTADVSLAATGNVVTVTHTAHGLKGPNNWMDFHLTYHGGWAFVENVSNAAFENGRHQITILNDNQYRYTVAGTPPPTGTAKINTDKTKLYNLFRWVWDMSMSGFAIRRADTHEAEHIAWGGHAAAHFFRDHYP